MSFTRSAPAAIQALTTDAFEVSTESTASGRCSRIALRAERGEPSLPLRRQDRSRSGGLGTEIEDVRSILGHGESPGDAGGTAHALSAKNESSVRLRIPMIRVRPPRRSSRPRAAESSIAGIALPARARRSRSPHILASASETAARMSQLFQAVSACRGGAFPRNQSPPPAGPCRTDPRCGGLSGENVPNGLRRPEEMEARTSSTDSGPAMSSGEQPIPQASGKGLRPGEVSSQSVTARVSPGLPCGGSRNRWRFPTPDLEEGCATFPRNARSASRSQRRCIPRWVGESRC
jgi:hypothetical protein